MKKRVGLQEKLNGALSQLQNDGSSLVGEMDSALAAFKTASIRLSEVISKYTTKIETIDSTERELAEMKAAFQKEQAAAFKVKEKIDNILA